MATGPITQISDVIVPEIFSPYVTKLTAELSAIIMSGALIESPDLNEFLMGGGLTTDMPAMKDLDNEEENVSSDDADDAYTGGTANSTPKKVTGFSELAVRLSRNQSWSSADLTAALSGIDPMQGIAMQVAGYRARRLQAAFIATMKGVFADNAAAPTGTEHVQNDLTNDISSTGYTAGVTDFSSSAFIDATLTMGDAMGSLTLVAVHSIVYARMQKNNLIDFIPDARGETTIPTFLGRVVVVDDGVPSPSAGVYETWLFGAGAVRYGMGDPKVPTETKRDPDAGNGGGAEVLYNRWEWAIHPNGHRYVGTTSKGGPSNAATTNNLAHADSWQRVYPERKQVKIARLITREF